MILVKSETRFGLYLERQITEYNDPWQNEWLAVADNTKSPLKMWNRN